MHTDWLFQTTLWFTVSFFPALDEPTPPRPSDSPDQTKRIWSHLPPTRHPRPATQNPEWPRRELDYFVLSKLEKNKLGPRQDARPATLLRRLYFDLIGLPPSPETVQQFEQQASESGLDAAVESQVDQLLSSEQFGERWGRHWLDVARFAESSGKETNVSFPHAWRYRNYVIDSWNCDKPYNQFLTEQIAGDLLPYETDEKRAELIIASGFLALGPKSLNETNRFQFLADVADEQIDTVTRAVLASSIACARCHDHKYDPFTMRDYYALAGIFVSTKTYYGTSVAPGNQVGGDLLQLPELPNQVVPNQSMTPKRVRALKSELAALAKEKVEGMAAARKAALSGEDPSKYFSLRDALRILWRSGAIEGQLKTVEDSGKAKPLAMGVSDREEIIDVPMLERGEIDKPGERVARGFPSALKMPGLPVPADQSGRIQLARWLTHPENPLTARVMANRVWRNLFGSGLVRTVDNFGAKGEAPSHPRLLDHLAVKLVEDQWSLKSLIREIVLSRTYRQSSDFDAAAFEVDPHNRLLWRANKRRLDAESIRDAMLSVAGRLDLTRPRASLIATIGNRPISIIAFSKNVPADLDGSRHRSVYLPILRDRLPDVLDLFDCAEPSLVTGDRETTNVPLQALFLMNSEFVQHCSVGLSNRIAGKTDDLDAQINSAFRLCFARSPEPPEFELAKAYFSKQSEDGLAGPRTLMLYCQALLSTAEFRNID